MDIPPSDPPDQPPDGARPPSTGDRLDSWKEIAAFLRRDVRTVQRWEKQAGLPVHRHAESRLRTAYAYRSELEAWWRTQRDISETAPEPVTAASSSTWTTHPWRAAAVLLGVAVIAVTALVFRTTRTRTPPVQTPPVIVVLIPFAADRADLTLATTLQEHIAQELEMHPGVETLAPARVARMLRLMRREASSPLSEAAGREVAVRDGSVRYAVTGRVHSVNSRFFVDIAAVDPADGRVRLSVEWDGATREQLFARVRKRSQQFAELLVADGAKPTGARVQLEQVTTASLPALRLYTAAVEAGRRRQWGASEMLARRAIEADDRFASALAWTGWSMRQQGRPTSECLPPLERAVELTPEISDRESYFVSGAYRTITGDLSRAISAFEALLRLQPGNADATDLLVDAYTRAGRIKEAVDLSVSRAEQARDDFFANVRAAHALAITRRDTRGGMAFVQQARKLSSAPGSGDRPSWSAWLAVFPVFQHWLAGDPRAGLDMLAPVEQSLAGRLGRERDAHATAVGFAHLAFGRRAEAEQAFRYAATPLRQLNLAMMAVISGDEEAARRWLSQIPEHASVRPALFAQAGLEEDANRGLMMLPIGERSPGIASVARGLVAARRGQRETATVALRQGMDLLRFSGEPEYFFAAEALAAIARARGDHGRSVRLLHEAVAEPVHTYAPSQWTAACWIRLNEQLAGMYQSAGRLDEADRIHESLRRVLGSDVAHGPVGRPERVKGILPTSAPR